jgi:two-component system, cell cycle response regulator
MVGNILIVDSVATNRIVFKTALGEAFYQTVFATDKESCLRLVCETPPDLVLVDLALQDGSSIPLIKQLKAEPLMRDVPVIGLAEAGDTEVRLLAFQAGVEDVLAKPIDLQSLLARVRNLLRNSERIKSLTTGTSRSDIFALAEATTPFEGPAAISLLAADPDMALSLQSTLAKTMADRITIQSPEDAFQIANGAAGLATPDVFLVETSVTDNGRSLRLMSELRSRSSTQHAAICILRPKGNLETVAMAYDLGADDVIDIETPAHEIAARLRAMIRRKRYSDQIRATVQDGLRLAVFDPLTGLHNRRYALPQLAAIAERAALGTTVFAVMIIDLDKFKSVNDRFGHAAGDAVLVEVAGRLRANLRADDLLARIGGEEFLVALPSTSFEDASAAADRLCRAVEEQSIALGFNATVRVTVSIGLAISKTQAAAEPIAKIMERADRALLKAKADGRNKVAISKGAA